MSRALVIATFLAAGLLGAGYWWMGRSDSPQPLAEIRMPQLSETARRGRIAFVQNCAACHGPVADGTESGPPLIHPVYEPGHHGDMAFLLAARNGVRAHHWRFGDMPPVEGVTDEEVDRITRFIREVQVANGIH